MSTRWGRVKSEVPVGEWIESLKSHSMFEAVTGWWSGISEWYRAKWADFESIFVPDFLKKQPALDLWGTGSPSAGSLSRFRP